MTTIKPWTKLHPLSDQNAFICLVDHMGDDSSIVQAARVSYGKDEQNTYKQSLIKTASTIYNEDVIDVVEDNVEHHTTIKFRDDLVQNIVIYWNHASQHQAGILQQLTDNYHYEQKDQLTKDRNLIRYLMNHGHTTPFEMVEIKFMVQVPMDCWRQWIRHRTANVNEYSTRYTEALDFFQVTDPSEWRLQATDNKQGSSGFLETDSVLLTDSKGGEYFSANEKAFHESARDLYEQRLKAGVAKEQARKDLPLSTYTRAYWKCDLHNIFNFLRLRMDSPAQLEIRQFANAMFEIVRSICPVACEAFEDYVLHAKKFSRMEMFILQQAWKDSVEKRVPFNFKTNDPFPKPDSMTDREWKEFLEKLK